MDIRRILQLLDFKNHPDHLSGRKSKAMLFGEFADLIASNTVSWQAFQLYCRGLATCANELDFVQLVCRLEFGQICPLEMPFNVSKPVKFSEYHIESPAPR